MAVRIAPNSFRFRLLLVVFAAAVLPLALVGFWLTRSVVNAGQSLLRSELDSTVTRVAASAAGKWSDRQGQLVQLAQNASVNRMLAAQRADPFTQTDSVYLAALVAAAVEMIPSVEYRTADGRVRWTRSTASNENVDERGAGPSQASTPMMTVRFPAGAPDGTGRGQMIARVRLDHVLPADTALRLPSGAILQVLEKETRHALLPGRVADSLLARDRFTVDGGDWLATHRPLAGAPIDLVVAAPTQRYVAPFARAAHEGGLAVGFVALLAIVLTAYLTSRLTRSLESLAVAAEAVARGDLDHQVERDGPDEVGRVAAAFNSMTENLRRTLGELSQRQALSAVGEYAASLSHEIRNALTAIRVDLQRAEEKIAFDVVGRPLIVRALENVTKLESTVSRSLQLARSGMITRRRIDLRDVLSSAAQSAEAAFAECGGVLEPPAFNGATWIRGDAASLVQLFLNLLLNSAQSLQGGGSARVALDTDGASARVVVSDTGRGIKSEDLSRVLDPFFSTKTTGTGLGLPIARQIAVAHGGSLHVESRPSEGTKVEVRLPLA